MAIAAIAVGCSDTDSFKEVSKQDNAIGFATYTSKQTRAENSSATVKHNLEDHQTSFKVWGYKNVTRNGSATKERVFNAQDVDWNNSNTAWEYTPTRFWDKTASSYEFYAAAPKDLGWVMADGGETYAPTAQATTYKISLASFTLDGAGIAIDNEASLPTSASASAVMPDNKDIMISEDVTNYYAYTSDPVNLHFIHILSRLNVGVKKDANVLPDADYTVRLKSLMVKQLIGNGSFNEASASGSDLQNGTNARWADLSTVTKIDNGFTSTTKDANNNVIGAVIGGTNFSYVYQALVRPQNVAFQRIAVDGQAHAARVCADVNEYNYYLNDGADIDATAFGALSEQEKTIPAYVAPTDPYLVINYTITPTASGATTEEYVAYYNLASAFGATSGNVAFNEGWMNTLNITISPAAINFDADVYEWSEKYPSSGDTDPNGYETTFD